MGANLSKIPCYACCCGHHNEFLYNDNKGRTVYGYNPFKTEQTFWLCSKSVCFSCCNVGIIHSKCREDCENLNKAGNESISLSKNILNPVKPYEGVATVILQPVNVKGVEQTLPDASVIVQGVEQILPVASVIEQPGIQKLFSDLTKTEEKYKTLVINGAFGICGAMTFNCLTNTMLCPLCLVGRMLGCMLGGCGEHIWFSYDLTDWRDTSIKVSPCLEFPVVK